MAKVLTKFSDMHRPGCEARAYKVKSERREHGRSTIRFDCPFCDAEIEAYIWSLCGGGKRCGCGAIFGGLGQGYKRTTTQEQAETGRNDD